MRFFEDDTFKKPSSVTTNTKEVDEEDEDYIIEGGANRKNKEKSGPVFIEDGFITIDDGYFFGYLLFILI